MEHIDWLQMLAYKEELHRLSRTLLSQSQKKSLTASELELLSIIYLYPNESTPLELSHKSGMKKEAVSRCLKQLFQKECIQKEKLPSDERSYMISLTQTGTAKLQEDYALILKPFYDLAKGMGEDFEKMFGLIGKANQQFMNRNENN